MKPTFRTLLAVSLPAALAGALIFAAPSCSNGSPPPGPCKTDRDCPNGTVCSGGKCLISRGSGSSGAGSTSGTSGNQASSGGGSGSSSSQVTGWGNSSSSSGASTTSCASWPCGGGSSSSGSTAPTCSCSTSCCSIDEGSAPSGTMCPGSGKYCYGTVPDGGGDFFCNIQTGKCDPFDPCSGSSGVYSCTAGSSSGGTGSSSSGTVAATVDPTGLSFVVTGDTRPDGSGDPYPQQIINAIYTDFGGLSPKPMVVVASGDFQEEGDSDPTGEIGDYEQAIGLFTPAGGAAMNPPQFPTYPAMGNHECVSTSITTYCGVSGPNQGNNTSAFSAYMQMLSDLKIPNTNGQPYYYETITAPNGDTAKFVITAANAWDSTQSAWLTTTLAVPSTFTFIARHEPDDAIGCTDATANDNTTSNCPFIAEVQSAINAAPVPVTLKLEGHTHDIRFDTYNDAIVSGSGGVSIEAGCATSDTIYCNYGYVWCQEMTNKTFQCSAYDYQSGLVMAPASGNYPARPMQFIAANGAPNPGTLSYGN